MAKVKVTTLIEEITASFLDENGLELYNVEFLKEGRDWFLRVYIDKKEGQEEEYVSTDDCEKVSRFLSEKLDELDPIDCEYCLEVCSPGIERELSRPEHFAAYIGADLKLADDGTTSWPNHILDSLENVNIRFDPSGKWWTKTVEFYHVLRRTLGDDVMIAAPTLSAGLDGLVGLYNAQDLIITMIDEPELVKEALAQINTAFTEIIKEVRRVFEFDKYGSINRHGMYVNGSIGVPQCDFSCMISSEMFREFALDSIAHEMSELDYAEYHLDGPGAIHHLEDLCTLEKLHTVQWVAGAGNAQKQDWTWLYQKIVSLGKAVLTGGNTSSVLALQNVLHTKSAYHKVSCQTRDEAERFMEELEKIEKN